eukprot:2365435-Prorocentrum_lima.AAC.1
MLLPAKTEATHAAASSAKQEALPADQPPAVLCRECGNGVAAMFAYCGFCGREVRDGFGVVPAVVDPAEDCSPFT